MGIYISGVWISVTNANIAKMERMSARENVFLENRRKFVNNALTAVQKTNSFINISIIYLKVKLFIS